MGIMSDKTRITNTAFIKALIAGLRIGGAFDPTCNIAADVLEKYGERALEIGYDKLGMTDEVTVNAPGQDVTGTIES
jgi:hypothetical protein